MTNEIITAHHASIAKVSPPRTKFSSHDADILTRRLCAYLIDWIIGLTICRALISGLVTAISDVPMALLKPPGMAFMPITEISALLYFVLPCISPLRGTAGMILMRIAVVDTYGHTRRFWPETGRYCLFSLTLFYMNRRTYYPLILVDFGIITPEALQAHIQDHAFMMAAAKYALIALLYVLPYIKMQRTLGDYLTGAKVIRRGGAQAAG